MGIKAFRDPALTQDFEAPRLPIDVDEPHLYAVDWDADEAVFTVDGSRAPPLPAPADVPAPADARRLRLPRVVGRATTTTWCRGSSSTVWQGPVHELHSSARRRW